MKYILLATIVFSWFGCGSVDADQKHIPFYTQISSMADLPIYDSYDDLTRLFIKDNDTTYLVNYWATWCKPCIEELPYFETIHKTLLKEKVRVILVSLDFPDQIETKLIPFIRKNKIAASVVFLNDPKSNYWIDQVNQNWSGGLPATITYRIKETKWFKEGSFSSYDELFTMLKPYIIKS